MKISNIEIEGFRGIRERISVSLPSGFVVIVGRNGAGKSTICDAIEFALTGTISRHRSGSEKGESIDEYLWWRGSKPAEDNYVSVTFSDKTGREHNITRRLDGRDPENLAAVKALICVQNVDPTKGLVDACRTSIIRDELITDLSVDMSETERFEFVRAAVGSANLKPLETKLLQLQSMAADAVKSAEREYDRQRDRVVQVVGELSRLRSDSPIEREIALSEKRLRAFLDMPDAQTQELVSHGRKLMTEYRLRIERGSRLVSRIETLNLTNGFTVMTEVDLKQSLINLKIEKQTLDNYANKIIQLRGSLDILEQVSLATSSLAELHLHGSEIGLLDGNCPLCGSAISEQAFRKHMQEIERGLQESSVHVAGIKQQIIEGQEAERKQNEVVKDLIEKVRKLELAQREREAFRNEVRAVTGLTDVDDVASSAELNVVASWLENQRKELADLESSVISLEGSQQLSRIADRNRDIDLAQNESRRAELVLERTKEAAGHVKTAIDSLKRYSGESVDVRLASISPLLEEFYSRLRPHVDWPEISYLIRGDVRRLLSLRVGDGLNLRYMFSSGQRRAAGLAFLLAVSLSRPWCGLRTIVLDDPVQHIDDYRALHLTETLTAIRKSGFQVICTVEDAELGALLSRRLRSTTEEAGLVVEMNYEASSGGGIVRQRPVLPFPTEVLRSA